MPLKDVINSIYVFLIKPKVIYSIFTKVSSPYLKAETAWEALFTAIVSGLDLLYYLI